MVSYQASKISNYKMTHLSHMNCALIWVVMMINKRVGVNIIFCVGADQPKCKA